MRTLAALLVAGLTGALALVVLLASPAADVVVLPPAQRVPVSNDRDVLAVAAADTLIAVERDPDGTLVMVLPPDLDPLALEWTFSAPRSLPPGTGLALAVGAVLAGVSVLRRWAGALAAGVLGATGTLALVAGGGSIMAVVALAGAVGLIAALRDHRFGTGSGENHRLRCRNSDHGRVRTARHGLDASANAAAPTTRAAQPGEADITKPAPSPW